MGAGKGYTKGNVATQRALENDGIAMGGSLHGGALHEGKGLCCLRESCDMY